jgi:hypothetical protein
MRGQRFGHRLGVAHRYGPPHNAECRCVVEAVTDVHHFVERYAIFGGDHAQRIALVYAATGEIHEHLIRERRTHCR